MIVGNQQQFTTLSLRHVDMICIEAITWGGVCAG